MKGILLSIRPEWVEKILNGEKTIEIRKKFPKDYIGWIYIYCTKSNDYLLDKDTMDISKRDYFTWDKKSHHYPFKNVFDEYTGKKIETEELLNGHVLARFWCDKVEEINPKIWNPTLERSILSASCLTEHQLFEYIERNNDEIANLPFYAIHISKLEIFERPKELIQKAPQNYCYLKQIL